MIADSKWCLISQMVLESIIGKVVGLLPFLRVSPSLPITIFVYLFSDVLNRYWMTLLILEARQPWAGPRLKNKNINDIPCWPEQSPDELPLSASFSSHMCALLINWTKLFGLKTNTKMEVWGKCLIFIILENKSLYIHNVFTCNCSLSVTEKVDVSGGMIIYFANDNYFIRNIVATTLYCSLCFNNLYYFTTEWCVFLYRFIMFICLDMSTFYIHLLVPKLFLHW